MNKVVYENPHTGKWVEEQSDGTFITKTGDWQSEPEALLKYAKWEADWDN